MCIPQIYSNALYSYPPFPPYNLNLTYAYEMYIFRIEFRINISLSQVTTSSASVWLAPWSRWAALSPTMMIGVLNVEQTPLKHISDNSYQYAFTFFSIKCRQVLYSNILSVLQVLFSQGTVAIWGKIKSMEIILIWHNLY